MKTATIIIFTLFIHSMYAQSIRYPVSPAEPQVPETDETQDAEEIPENSPPREIKKAKKGNTIRVNVSLGSGDTIYGNITIPVTVTFEHYKNGFVYKKNLATRDIKSMEILHYAASPALAEPARPMGKNPPNIRMKEKTGEHKKKPEEVFHKFYPDRVLVRTYDGNQFELNYLFPFLHRFLIENSDGSTWMYCIFGDTWSTQTGWEEAQTSDVHYHDTNPHPKSVKMIHFQGGKGGISE